MKKETDLKSGNYFRFFTLMLIGYCLILMCANPVYGFYDNNNVLLNNSDSHVLESSHLIELDLNHEGVIFVQESIVFSIIGNETPDHLAVIVPELCEITSFQRIEMMGNGSNNMNYTRNKNILYFNDPNSLSQSAMPVLYELQYVLEDNDDLSSRSFLKHFYNSETPLYPIDRLSVMVNYPEGVHVHLTDGEGNAIKADSVKDESNIVSFKWSNPDIEILSVNTHKAIESASDTGSSDMFLILLISGTVVIAVLLLHSRRKGNADIRDLEDNYEALLAVIIQLEDDHRSKLISGGDFRSLHKKYKSQAMETKKRIDNLRNKK